HNQGLGASIIGRMGNELTGVQPEVYKKVKEKLNIPDNIIIMTMLAIGYPSENFKPLPKKRKKAEFVISYEKYEKK
ncbi:MAG: NADH-quinone oxidoreductase subunit H, partial [Bacteroidota bacterium]|nr:NADH-quinone oxidoreductase subunit H [Bacteroidota bacterium]